MAEKRKYTDEDRALVLAVFASTGRLRQTSRETGVPITTIKDWLKNWLQMGATNHSLAAAVVAVKASLADKLEVKLDMVIEAITPEKIREASLLHLATCAGILSDKIRSLRLDSMPSQRDIAAAIVDCVPDPEQRRTIAEKLNVLFCVVPAAA